MLFKKFRKSELKSNTLDCVVAYNPYGAYCIPSSSRHPPVPRKVLANKIHEPETIRFMMENCSGGDIVHAGAYFGDFLPALDSAVDDHCNVWAFEPNGENFRCAKITIALNDLKRVRLTHAGLGESEGASTMQTKDDKGKSLGGGSRIAPSTSDDDALKSEQSENIHIVALDDVLPQNKNISIIQLDVEGFEKQALTGALKTIQRCKPIIILEVWRKSTLVSSDWFKKQIFGLGYREAAPVHGNKVFVCS